MEGLVEQADAVSRGDGRDRLRREDARAVELAAGVQRAVQPRDLPHRSAPTATRDAAGEELGIVERVQRDDLCALGVVHGADPLAVRGVTFRRHPDPAVVHAEWEEHLFADVLLEAAPVDPAHDLGQHRHPAREVVAGASAGLPALLALDRADAGDHLVPVRVAGRGARDLVAAADARGVGEQVAQRDPVLGLLGELGHVAGDGIVGRQRTPLPLLRDGHGHRRLRHREPRDEGIARHRDTRARLADREVGHFLTSLPDAHLRAEVQPAVDAGRQHGGGSRQRVHQLSKTCASCDCCHAPNISA